jgi:hypothetical protein
MADYAGEARRHEDGTLDEDWREVVREHGLLLKRFGMGIVPDSARNEFELELISRRIPVLHRHHSIG